MQSTFNKKKLDTIAQNINKKVAFVKTDKQSSKIEIELTNVELKKLAFSYGVKRDSIKSVELINKYIRQAHDYTILNDSEFEFLKGFPGFCFLYQLELLVYLYQL